ncbi:MAG TPA: type II toxin-antitoxin system death-on-curing family toxin [Terriglobales bacterium]|nr:type II toxin-antitoxin system death-on-curing family toxin [Terriglobales bacterium]
MSSIQTPTACSRRVPGKQIAPSFANENSVRDKGAVEAAVFRPQTGYYNSLEEEAAALMESLGNNHGFLDGNKRIAFTAADVFLRRNGSYIEVESAAGYEFIAGSMERHEFRFIKIVDWIRRHAKPLHKTDADHD